MPRLDGIAAATVIRRHNSNARIVLVTVHADPMLVEAGLAAGALRYVLKDMAGDDRVAAVRAALDGRPLARPKTQSVVNDGELSCLARYFGGDLDEDCRAFRPKAPVLPHPRSAESWHGKCGQTRHRHVSQFDSRRPMTTARPLRPESVRVTSMSKRRSKTVRAAALPRRSNGRVWAAVAVVPIAAAVFLVATNWRSKPAAVEAPPSARPAGFLPTVENTNPPPGPAPAGMVWMSEPARTISDFAW